jgi:hypothetical protein
VEKYIPFVIGYVGSNEGALDPVLLELVGSLSLAGKSVRLSESALGALLKDTMVS